MTNKIGFMARTCLKFFTYGVLFWVFDSFVDYIYFYKNPGGLLDLIILKIPVHELYMRTSVVLLLVLFGYIYSRSQKELKKQKQFFEQMFLQSSTSTQILDSEGWCVRINPELSRLFGVRPENMEGHMYNIFKDGEIIRSGVADILEKVFKQGETAEWEMFFDIGHAADSQNIHVDEKRKAWFYCKAHPIFDSENRVEYVIIQHEDITPHKLRESALHTEKERLRVTPQSIGDAVISTDVDGRVVTLNRIAEDLTGWKQEEAIGRPLEEIFHIMHEDTEKLSVLYLCSVM